MDKIIRAINVTKEYSITTCITTDILKEIVANQGLVTGFSNNVCDIVSANVLMTNTLKEAGEEIVINLRTDGMLSQITSNGDYDGNFSGYATLNNQSAERIIGKGILEVSRFYNGKEIRTSTITTDSHSISDIIVDYYFQSEQVYSVVILASLSDKKTNEFYAGGGILIQLLPGASEEIKDQLLEKLAQIEDLSKKIALGMSAEELVYLIDDDAQILEEKVIKYNCKCSRENILESIKSIDYAELKKIIEEDGELKVICNACNKSYVYQLEDLNE